MSPTGRTLDVLLHGQLVGQISLDRAGEGTFKYLPDTVKEHWAEPLLSCSMPVGPEPFNSVLTRNWFSGLLPEGDQRAAAARAAGVPSHDDFLLLEKIGWECAGAVAVGPAGFAPEQEASLQLVSHEELASMLDRLPQWPVQDAGEVRSSLGGFQSKLLLTRVGEGWALPLQGAISTHLVKPEKTEYQGMAAAEAWAMTLAGAATPAAAVSMMGNPEDVPALLVTRFDRTGTKDGVRRLHQEDGCQMLGSPPHAKYASDSAVNSDGSRAVRPSLHKIAGAVSRYSNDPRVQLLTLLRQVTVNIAVGNAGAHAKNYSLMLGPVGCSVSPMYDVVPTMHFLPQTDSAGLWVNGNSTMNRIFADDIAEEGASWGIPRRLASATVKATLERLGASIQSASDAFPSVPDDIPAMVAVRIARMQP
ncbi:HipA domain-containing protein [Arthrobacter sp. H5]|uniref:type II toxin-antitoxin system HipA family toxin n=1 Tax=Arthrobacter sp. H5 TaxID=1267973 RepID=UPI0004AEDA03|nr:HipA domain-containing protein [Arthrobacter sp. H5]